MFDNPGGCEELSCNSFQDFLEQLKNIEFLKIRYISQRHQIYVRN